MPVITDIKAERHVPTDNLVERTLNNAERVYDATYGDDVDSTPLEDLLLAFRGWNLSDSIWGAVEEGTKYDKIGDQLLRTRTEYSYRGRKQRAGTLVFRTDTPNLHEPTLEEIMTVEDPDPEALQQAFDNTYMFGRYPDRAARTRVDVSLARKRNEKTRKGERRKMTRDIARVRIVYDPYAQNVSVMGYVPGGERVIPGRLPGARGRSMTPTLRQLAEMRMRFVGLAAKQAA